MSRFVRCSIGTRMAAAAVACAFVVLSAVPGGAAPLAPAGPQQSLVPCDPVGTREVSPRVVEEGAKVHVKVHYDFNCVSKTRRINFILIVETTVRSSGVVRADLLRNLKEGLKSFVNVVDFENGSTGSLVLVGDQYTIRMPLRGGREGKTELLRQIEQISLEPIGGSAGFGQAINDAVGRLPTNVADEDYNVIIIFDRGAPETTGSNPEPPVTRDEGCQRARRAKVPVVVVGHEDSQGRMVTCASAGYYASSGDKAPDLPQIFRDVADAVLRGKQAKNSEYSDYLQSSYFEYVTRSGQPREPTSILGSEITWNSATSSKPPGGFTIEYDVVTMPGFAPEIQPLSIDARLSMLYSDNSLSEIYLDNPEVCIYRKGREQQDCGAFIRALTPTAPPPLETPTPTAPTAPPTDPPTPTPTPTDTPVPAATDMPTATDVPPPTDTPTAVPPPTATPRPGIFLPALLNGSGFQG